MANGDFIFSGSHAGRTRHLTVVEGGQNAPQALCWRDGILSSSDEERNISTAPAGYDPRNDPSLTPAELAKMGLPDGLAKNPEHAKPKRDMWYFGRRPSCH
ncbi:MAG: hypothetical protein COY40_02240 [Alphaproteobacteria bacterium CG_4_10_14_0_8_um_filter_53_9]|nr:MAG: hypothetical protein COY40_02240 [Alphaproteobacteria bacterium CG_4_10_14_0_8_um_filter_53_9]